MTEALTVQALIAKIRTWQTAAAKYDEACEEARQINDGKSYPSSPARRSAIKLLDAAAMELIHDVHNDVVLEMLVALADEIERLQARIDAALAIEPRVLEKNVTDDGYAWDGGYNAAYYEFRAALGAEEQ